MSFRERYEEALGRLSALSSGLSSAAASQSSSESSSVRNLIFILGDQLDPQAGVLEGFDPSQDILFMAEAEAESTHVWSHKQRIALFLSAMRHYALQAVESGKLVDYRRLDDPNNSGRLSQELEKAVEHWQPERILVQEPGEWRIRDGLEKLARKHGWELEIQPSTHFYASREDFRRHAEGRKELRMEYFYREMRKRHRVLLDDDGKPLGGKWNYDQDNRESFGKKGPGDIPQPKRFLTDAITREVITLVEDYFSGHPGGLETFQWPVTPKQAQEALEDFLQYRLGRFGRYQDALWEGEPFLYHSLISSSLNLQLLNPREAVEAAEQAYHEEGAPLAAVEGFIRQILGWREYVRGIYWLHMPEYLERNALQARADLPSFFWTGRTALACQQDAIGSTLRYGYAHHIQRLMVTGLYALLLGVRPQEVHAWYLAVYVDAVEWVELPNTLGMSQYGDGGVMASKPYAATGKYISRMGNHCANCPFDPKEATGVRACPITTLYWHFLHRHQDTLRHNRRMALQVRNLERLTSERLEEIEERAHAIMADPSGLSLLPAGESKPKPHPEAGDLDSWKGGAT